MDDIDLYLTFAHYTEIKPTESRINNTWNQVLTAGIKYLKTVYGTKIDTVVYLELRTKCTNRDMDILLVIPTYKKTTSTLSCQPW